ncbi:MAG TPA: WG repeat-containing protein [Fluviicola sp.]|nr:WG repeat-containing protein [Fluviicola sp.]
MLTRLILYCCCLIPLFTKGQELRIAKDNLLCAYGLKNDQQKWVVEPSFVTLEPIGDGAYKTFDGQHYGLLNAQGKEITPPVYDNITPYEWIGFQVKKDEKVGLVNLKGQLKIKPEYYKITAARNGKLLLYRTIRDTFYTTYADTSGKVLLAERQGIILPFSAHMQRYEEERSVKARAFIGNGFYGFDNVMQNVGVIDEDGKEIIPRIYDRIDYRDEQSYWVWKNGKFGAISRSGQTIIEPKYFVSEIGAYSNGQDIRGNTDRLLQITGDGGKIGLMHTSGKIPLEPKYDKIERMFPDMRTDRATYLVYAGTKTGVAGKDGFLSFDVIYDTLIPIAVRDEKTPYGQQQKILANYFFFRQDGKYGLMKYDGTVLVKPCYDLFARVYDRYSRQSMYCLSDQAAALMIYLPRDSVVLDEMKQVSSFDHIKFFQSTDGLLYPFKQASAEAPLQFIESYERNKYLIAVREFPRDYKTLLFDTKGKPAGGKNIRFVENFEERYAVVRCEQNKVGLLDITSRKWVLDTIYLDVKQSHNGKGVYYFWGQLYPPKGDYISPGWQVFDTLGRLKSKTIFANVVTGGDTVVVESKGKRGVMNGQLEWIIDPNYQHLHRVSTNHFVVYTPGRHFGLINTSGKLVVDTVYTEFEQVYSFEDRYGTNGESIEKPSQWWLFSNEKQRRLYNNYGDSWSSTGPVYEQQQLNEHLDDFVLKGNRNYSHNALRLYMDLAMENEVRKAAFRHDLVERVRSEYDKKQHCNDFYRIIYNHNDLDSPCRSADDIYRLVDFGSRFYTLKTSYYVTHYSMEMPMESEEIFHFDNVIQVGNTFRKVELKDIFGNGNLLQEELLRAIKERDDLNLDCSASENMVGRLEGRFSLSNEGVTLYYGTNTIGTVSFLIPNARLGLHAESKWLVSYLQGN